MVAVVATGTTHGNAAGILRKFEMNGELTG